MTLVSQIEKEEENPIISYFCLFSILFYLSFFSHLEKKRRWYVCLFFLFLSVTDFPSEQTRSVVLFRIKEKLDTYNLEKASVQNDLLEFVCSITSDFSMTLRRILCLHGYRQNGTLFREKTGSLRKLLKKHVSEFVYIDAPHLIPGEEIVQNEAINAAAAAGNRSNERGTFILIIPSQMLRSVQKNKTIYPVLVRRLVVLIC